MTVRYLEAARCEFEAAIDFYEDQTTGLGDRFLDEVLAVEQRINQFPESGAVLEGQYQRCPVKSFPYALIYWLKPDEAIVVSVYHLRRKPGQWKGRI